MTTSTPPILGKYAPTNNVSPVFPNYNPPLGSRVSVNFIIAGWLDSDPAGVIPLGALDDEIDPIVTEVNPSTVNAYNPGTDFGFIPDAVSVSRDGMKMIIESWDPTKHAGMMFVQTMPDQSWPRLENGTYTAVPATVVILTTFPLPPGTYHISAKKPKAAWDKQLGKIRLSWPLRSLGTHRKRWRTKTPDSNAPGVTVDIFLPNRQRWQRSTECFLMDGCLIAEFDALPGPMPGVKCQAVVTMPDPPPLCDRSTTAPEAMPAFAFAWALDLSEISDP